MMEGTRTVEKQKGGRRWLLVSRRIRDKISSREKGKGLEKSSLISENLCEL